LQAEKITQASNAAGRLYFMVLTQFLLSIL